MVLIATGVEWRILEAEGVERFQGRGVLYGASRNEASNVVGKRVVIVGGGNSAGQAAVFFANYAAKVVVLVRGKGLELTMSSYLIDQIATKKNIHVVPYTEVMKAEGEDHLERVTVRTRPPEGEETTGTYDVGCAVHHDWREGEYGVAAGEPAAGLGWLSVHGTRPGRVGTAGAGAVSAGDESAGGVLRGGCAA